MSLKEELAIAVLTRFVLTPKDPITAHVDLDMKGTKIIAQVIFFVPPSFCIPLKAFLFFFYK